MDGSGTMIEYTEKNAKRWSVLGERPTLGLAIYEIAKSDSDIMVVNADVTNSAGLGRMLESLPEQIVNVGIAEQNMMLVATGLASEGYKVITSSFAPFQSMRCLEQIRVYQGYMKQKLVMIGLLSGLASGYLGHTHCTTEDVALLRAIPNVSVVVPCDCMEVAKAVSAAIDYKDSVYIRLMGNANVPIVNNGDYEFCIGKGIVLKGGEDVAIIANGTMVFPSMQAAEKLEKMGISVTVINMHTVKPIDEELLDRLCCDSMKAIITVEEHSVIGGLGSAVAEYLCRKKESPVIHIMGIPDEYAHSSCHETMLRDYELTPEGITSKVLKVMEV